MSFDTRVWSSPSPCGSTSLGTEPLPSRTIPASYDTKPSHVPQLRALSENPVSGQQFARERFQQMLAAEGLPAAKARCSAKRWAPWSRAALTLPSEHIGDRVARRVDAQFARGIVDEVRSLLARGLPESAHPFSGLVYRQVLEYLHGVRSEADTRDLIVRENRHYARRQLIWFRKEPNLQWIHGAGEDPQTLQRAEALFTATRPL